MKGFFKKANKKLIGARGTNQKILLNPCGECGLHLNCRSPKMTYTGEGEKEILIIGEQVSLIEDVKGMFLNGRSGKYLRSLLKESGINMAKDCWKMNAISCYTDKEITKKQIQCCKVRVWKTIKELKPKFIFVMGTTASKAIYLDRFSQTTIGRWRKICIPDPKANAWVIPMYHPSAVTQNENSIGTKVTFEKDLKWAVSCTKKEPPVFVDYGKYVSKLFKTFDILKKLRFILDNEIMIAYDYETTGLKPYLYGHEIASISYAYRYQGELFCDSFCTYDKSEEELKQINSLWRQILESSNNKLIMHNMKFEIMWGRVMYKADHKGCHWCTMNAAHILDDRKHYVGLKFQSFIKFGVESYDSSIKPLLKAVEGTEFNRVKKIPIDDLLLYNGIDAVLTYLLYEHQYKILTRPHDRRSAAYFLTHNGLLALSDMEHTGINMDELYYRNKETELTVKIDQLNIEIFKSKEAVAFKKKMGRVINPDSDADLRILFFGILGLKAKSKTETGMDSINKESLGEIETDFTKALLLRKKYEKVKGTYLAQFSREIVNGVMHPFFDLHTARSYRGSSSRPNFQNIPVRDEEAKAAVRKGIMPSKGNKLLCVDFGSMEVRIIACYSKDKQLIKYIKNPTSDMHKDQAKIIFALNDEQVTAILRFFTKNQLVFPLFYGSWYKACAKNLWENCRDLETGTGTKITDHLVNMKIMKNSNDYSGFENHIKNCEDRFWKRFAATKKWQEKAIRDYGKKGYIELLTGYRRSGDLSKNIIVNTPVQGTAFHLLVWSFIKLNDIAKKRKWKSKLIANIHDELIFDLFPSEEVEVIRMCHKVMVEDTAKEFPWLIVPLDVEPEITEVDEAWYYNKEIPIPPAPKTKKKKVKTRKVANV